MQEMTFTISDDVYDIYDTLNLKEDNENYEETKIGLTTYTLSQGKLTHNSKYSNFVI
jgi:hypothetical protein